MITQGEDVEIHALKNQGWSISAIARHVDRDRKTVRAYVRGERRPGARRRSAPDAIEPFAPYLRARFDDDPHLWLEDVEGKEALEKLQNEKQAWLSWNEEIEECMITLNKMEFLYFPCLHFLNSRLRYF